MQITNQNFSGQEIPSIIADEYVGCNFSCHAPLDDSGVKTGVPLDVNATFTRCNLVNRKPHVDAVLLNCNTTIIEFGVAISETEQADIVYGHYDSDTKEAVYEEAPVITNERPKEDAE